MKAFVVATVSRQIEGEYVFVKIDRGFLQASKADDYRNKLKKELSNADGSVKIVKITTDQGAADCICEVGAFEVEIEE